MEPGGDTSLQTSEQGYLLRVTTSVHLTSDSASGSGHCACLGKNVRKVQAYRNISQCLYLPSITCLVACGSLELEVIFLCLLYVWWTLFPAQFDRILSIRNKAF